MNAFSNDNLKYGLGDGSFYDGIDPKITYTVTPGSRTVAFDDNSTFKTAGDSLEKVLVHAYANDGAEEHGAITAATSNGQITLTFPTGTDMSKMNLTATIISTLGYKYDLGIYSIGVVNGLTGSLANAAPQGKRATVAPPTT